MPIAKYMYNKIIVYIVWNKNIPYFVGPKIYSYLVLDYNRL